MTDEIVTKTEGDATDTPATDTPAIDTEAAKTDDAVVTQDFPNDWRDKMASGDADMAKMLMRCNSPADLAKKAYEQDKVIRSGAHKKFEPPGADASPEAMAEYRKAIGVPETPDKYTMPEGLVMGDADKPVVDAFLKDMHALNMPDALAKETVAWYFKSQQDAAAAEAEADAAFKAETEQTLRAEWGGEYKANYNMAESFAVGRFGDQLGRALMDAGPDTVKAVAALAREISPAASLMPNSQNPGMAVEEEYKTLLQESLDKGLKFPKEKLDRMHALKAGLMRMK